MVALERSGSGPRVPLAPERDFPFYIGKEPKVGKRYRKYFERSSNGAAQPGISAPSSPRRQHGRGTARVKALRPLRGAQDAALTQAFLPGPSLRHVGNVQVWRKEPLSARGCGRGLRCDARCQGPRFSPVAVRARELNAVLPSAYQGAD